MVTSENTAATADAPRDRRCARTAAEAIGTLGQPGDDIVTVDLGSRP